MVLKYILSAVIGYLLGSISFAVLITKGPVSYTHLDVYKRQLQA